MSNPAQTPGAISPLPGKEEPTTVPVVDKGDVNKTSDAAEVETGGGGGGGSATATVPLLGATSPGVQRVEAISQYLRLPDRVLFFVGIFLISYAYSLDGILRTTFQTYATASYNTHSLVATVGVLRGVIAAAAQPTAAKIADVFGRGEVVCVTIVFYVIGTIVEATSTNVQAFAAGAVLYQIGYTGILVLTEVLIADVTSLRSRLIFSFIPPSPFIINTWVSGDITGAIIANSTWQWGVGMWAIIYPACAVPLLAALYIVHRRAKLDGALDSYKTPYQLYSHREFLVSIFWQLDVIGVLLLIAVFALILVPFTLAGGIQTQWQTAKVIAPLVVGFALIPVFLVWEMRCPHPMVPFRLMKNRAIWAALGVAIMLNTSWAMQGNFLYTVLVVGFDESVKSATRISSLYSFTGTLTGCFVGLVVFKLRRLKAFIVTGTCLFMVAYGILIHFRGGVSGSSHSGVIGGQVFLGFATGLFSYPTLVSIQAATRHEHVAVITGLYMATQNIGTAIGNTISGVLWNQVLPQTLSQDIDSELAASAIYGDPFTFISENPVGTPVRDATMAAYQHIQRLLCITGICLSVVLIGFSLLLRDPLLGKEQSLPDAEKDT